MTDSGRCPVCDRDREGCLRLQVYPWARPIDITGDVDPGSSLCLYIVDCEANAVDWRSRALALEAKLNTPHIEEFTESVRIEAVHQVERWGVDHDAGKERPDWVTLLVYLLGKAVKAHFERDQPKLLHHIITAAAALLNWHAAETGVDNRMRPGIGP